MKLFGSLSPLSRTTPIWVYKWVLVFPTFDLQRSRTSDFHFTFAFSECVCVCLLTNAIFDAFNIWTENKITNVCFYIFLFCLIFFFLFFSPFPLWKHIVIFEQAFELISLKSVISSVRIYLLKVKNFIRLSNVNAYIRWYFFVFLIEFPTTKKKIVVINARFSCFEKNERIYTACCSLLARSSRI